MITLHAFLVRRPDLTHEQFLDHWRTVHGPLIRDTPELARHLVSYEQHAVHPASAGLGLGDVDGITVQRFADWDGFLAFVGEPAAAAMNGDMANFLDLERLQVAFTDEPVVVIGRG